MGPWASAIVAAASVAAVFFAVMGFRGLMDALERTTGRCASCGRTTMLPLPPGSHQCRRCHYALRWFPHPTRSSASSQRS